MGLRIGITIALLLVVIGMAVYVYHVLLRLEDTLGFDKRSLICKGSAGVATAVLLLIALGFTRTGLIVLIHLLVISWIVEGIDFFVRLKRKRGWRIWNLIVASEVIPIVLTAILLGYGYWNMGQVRETDYVVTTQKDIRDSGYTIAFVSDLHYPTTMGKEKLQAYCKEIGAKNPDFVILGGDIVDENTSYMEMQEAFEVLGGIPSRLGRYYVYGNHDLAGEETRKNFTKDQLRESIQKTGITVLEDSSVKLTKDLVLIGRADCGFANSKQRKSIHQLLELENKKKYLVVIDHQPKDLRAAANEGIDLQVSGHTHAGQIFPGGIISKWAKVNEQTYGCRRKNGFTSIVSSGIGGWGSSIRTEGDSEYVIIRLQK